MSRPSCSPQCSRQATSHMDQVLNLCDDFFLDAVWQTLAPVTAFLDPSPHHYTSSLSPKLTTTDFNARPTLNSSSVQTPSSTMSFPEESWPRDYLPRQALSIILFTWISTYALYFTVSGMSYLFIFDHKIMKHPKFLKNQIRQEICMSLWAIPNICVLSVPWVLAEVRGYSRLYENVEEYGWTWLVLSLPL